MILIGCEESQTVCGEFRKQGYEAFSCDLLPTRGNPDWHYQADIMEVIPLHWWKLIILHPDCTYMAVCNNRQAAKGKINHHLRLRDIKWTMKLWELAKANSDSSALENPGSVIFPHLRKAGATIQYVQPYHFGHLETKNTGLALYNLPELVPTNNVKEEMDKLPAKEKHKIWYASPGPNRKRDRSETYPGIAKAIVDQWG